MTVNSIMSVNKSAPVSQKASSGSENSFQNILMSKSNHYSENNDDIQVNKDFKEDAYKNSETVSDKTTSDVTENTSMNNVTETDTESAAVDAEKDNVSALDDSDEKVSDTNDENMVNQVLSVIETILKKLSELLQMSEEELQSSLADAGIDVSQLTDKNLLQQLVLQLNNSTDASMLLTDQGLSETLQNIFEEINQILNQSGLTAEEFQDVVNTDEFKEIMQQLTDMMKSNDSTFSEALNNFKNLFRQSQNQIEQPEDVTSKEVVITNESVLNGKQQSVESVTDTGIDDKLQNSEVIAADNSQEAGYSETNSNDASSAFTSFVQNIVNANQTGEPANAQTVSYQELTEIANQIIEKVKVTISPEQTNMELQLNPESLGKVMLSISSREGVMTAQMLTQNQIAKEAIESQIGTLYETLEQQGLKVDAIEVTVGGFEFNMNKETDDQQQNQQKSKKSGISLEDDLLISSEEGSSDDIYLGDSTVNYVA